MKIPLLVCCGSTLLCTLLSHVEPFTLYHYNSQSSRPRVTPLSRRSKSSSSQTPQRLFLSSEDKSVSATSETGSLPTSSLADVSGIESTSNGENDKAAKDLQIHRDALAKSLERINKLQVSLSQTADVDDEQEAMKAISSLEEELNGVEEEVSVWTRALVPPAGLSVQDYAKAISTFVKLPFRLRVAICSALELDDSVQAASDWERVPEIVALMYTDQTQQLSLLSPERIQNAVKEVEATLKNARMMSSVSTLSRTGASNPQMVSISGQSIFSNDNINNEKTQEEFAKEATVQQFLGRVTRKDDRVATEKELEILMGALDNKMFLPSTKPEPIQGGYIIRGKNQKKSGADLIASLDVKLPTDWKGQVCYMNDDFQTGEDGATASVLGDDADKVLLLLNKDMSSTVNPWLLASTTGAALCIAFLFSVGVYGGNDAFQTTISNQALFGDDSNGALGLLNSKVMEVFLSLGAIQFIHDFGQWIVARKDSIKTSFPTLLPGLGLPYLNSMVKIEESPKNFKSLFDYAIVGPLLGLGASFIFLVTGLQLTTLADPATAQLLPSLPVNVLCQSTLAVSIIDFLYGGGPGFVSLQDPESFVQMHPLAIAGFAGLLMNALEVLPIGGTDGGRMSLAVFGRSGHSIIGGLAWLILLGAALFLERGDALVGAWAVYNIAQSDIEIPCRDEVEQLDLIRSAAAGSLWFLAILILAPL